MKNKSGFSFFIFFIVTGTLSPLDSFASELGVPFPITLEARHVISPDRVFTRSVACGLNPALPLLVNYKNSSAFDFLDELGNVIQVLPCRLSL